MPEAGKDDLVFTKTTSDVGGIIEMPLAFDAVSVQNIVNAVRQYEDDVPNIDTAVGIVGTTGIVRGVGKVEFPSISGKFTGITATLINDWRFQAEARVGPSTVSIIVFGGSFFAENSFGNNPLSPTAFTQIQIQQTEAPPQLGIDNLLEKIGRNKMITDPVAGTITIFDDDGVTPLLTAPLFEDAAGIIPYKGDGADRRERMT